MFSESPEQLGAVNALADLRIELEGSKTFQEIWIPIIRLAGATVVDTLYSESQKQPDAVLLEEDPSETMRETAEKVIELPPCSTLAHASNMWCRNLSQ